MTRLGVSVLAAVLLAACSISPPRPSGEAEQSADSGQTAEEPVVNARPLPEIDVDLGEPVELAPPRAPDPLPEPSAMMF